MTSPNPDAGPDLPALVQRADLADPRAADQLFALLYDELHRLAERHLRRGGAELTVGSTTLVHESYLSMAGLTDVTFPDRARFFAYASRAMRGLIIDYSRRRRARKHDRGFEITFAEDAVVGAGEPESEELQALDGALRELAALDPRLAELVDLHFFGGFTFGEIAALRGVSERSVQRDWRKARLLLHRALHEG